MQLVNMKRRLPCLLLAVLVCTNLSSASRTISRTKITQTSKHDSVDGIRESFKFANDESSWPDLIAKHLFAVQKVGEERKGKRENWDACDDSDDVQDSRDVESKEKDESESESNRGDEAETPAAPPEKKGDLTNSGGVSNCKSKANPPAAAKPSAPVEWKEDSGETKGVDDDDDGEESEIITAPPPTTGGKIPKELLTDNYDYDEAEPQTANHPTSSSVKRTGGSNSPAPPHAARGQVPEKLELDDYYDYEYHETETKTAKPATNPSVEEKDDYDYSEIEPKTVKPPTSPSNEKGALPPAAERESFKDRGIDDFYDYDYGETKPKKCWFLWCN